MPKKLAKKKPVSKTKPKPVAKKVVAKEKLSPPKRMKIKKVISTAPVVENKESAIVIPMPAKPASNQTVPTPKLAWDNLPNNIPPATRWLVTQARLECSIAAEWPLPFAKFIAALPTEIGGIQFALMILSLEHGPEEIAQLCKMTASQVNQITTEGKNSIEEKFSTICSDLHRKWRTRLGGSGMEIEPLVDQHLVLKVNRDFQLLVGAIILRAIGAQNPVINGQLIRDRWSVSSIAAN